MTIASWAAALLLAAGAEATDVPPPPPGAPPAAAPARDPEAMALLRRMGERLQGAGTFTVRGRTALELPVAGGALATFSNSATVAVRRPDGLAVSRTGDLPEFRFVYDGRIMTAFAPASGKWGTAAAPPTLDAMIVAASEAGGLSFPFDELLVADPFSALTGRVTEVARVGPSTVGGRRTEHLLLALPDLQLELWIDPATALPARALVVYTDHPLRPHFSVEYSDWRLDAKLPASTFATARPPGATQVDFREACGAFR